MTEQNNLLENWEERLDDEYCINDHHGYPSLSLNATKDLIKELLEAQEAKTRQECAKIVEEMEIDSNFSGHWRAGYLHAKDEAKQKILNQNKL